RAAVMMVNRYDHFFFSTAATLVFFLAANCVSFSCCFTPESGRSATRDVRFGPKADITLLGACHQSQNRQGTRPRSSDHVVRPGKYCGQPRRRLLSPEDAISGSKSAQ